MKNKNGFISIIWIFIIIVILAAAVLIYRKHTGICTPSSGNYASCSGGCYDTEYYKQHIDECNKI